MTDLEMTLYFNKLIAIMLTTGAVMTVIALAGIGISTAYNWLQKVKRNKR